MKKEEISRFNRLTIVERVHILMGLKAEWLNKYWCPCIQPTMSKDFSPQYQYIQSNFWGAIRYISENIIRFAMSANIYDSIESENEMANLYADFIKVVRKFHHPTDSILEENVSDYHILSGDDFLEHEYRTWKEFDMDKVGPLCFLSCGTNVRSYSGKDIIIEQHKYGYIRVRKPDFRKAIVKKNLKQ